jgi:hypothetical protein
MFYSVKSGPEEFRACRIRGKTRRIATGGDARFAATPGAGDREPWNSYSQVVHRLPDFLLASQTQSVSAGKITLKIFAGFVNFLSKSLDPPTPRAGLVFSGQERCRRPA